MLDLTPELSALLKRPLCVIEVETTAHDAAGHLEKREGRGGLGAKELDNGEDEGEEEKQEEEEEEEECTCSSS